MNPFEFIGYTLGAISLVSLAGTAIYGKRGQYLRDLLNQENDALKEINNRLTSDNKELQFNYDKTSHENQYLRESASGRADFTVLSKQMAEQHTEVIKNLGSVATELSKLAKVIAKKEA